MRAERSARTVHALVIVALTALTYVGSLRGEFVSDDVQTIGEEPRIRSLAPANLRTIFSTFDGPNYMPLKVLSFAVDYHFWGTDPTGYHVVNVAFHAANALLVYALLLQLGESSGLALAVALLWAVHPVHVESVAWISERKNVLSTFFFLLAVLAYLRFSDRPRLGTYLLIATLYVAALLSKVNTIVLPAVMLAYELCVRFRLRARDLVATVPLLAIGVFLAWVNLAGNPSHGAAYHGGSLAVTLRTSATVVPRYLGLVFAPWQLRTYHAVPLRGSWLEPAVLAGVGTVLGLAVLAIVLSVRRRPGGFWIVWFGATLAPMLNLVPFPALMADRYLYMPLVGILVPLAWGVHALGARIPALARGVPALAGAAVAACLAFTVARVPVFHDELALWADWGMREPYISGDAPFRPQPRHDEIRLLKEALARRPDSAVLHNNLGGIAFDEGRLDDALAELTAARRLDPRDPAIALNLGRAYLRAGQPAAAARALEDAVLLEPPSYWAHVNLARAYLQLGDTVRARQAIERARAIKPHFTEWRSALAVLERLERQPAANAP